MKALGASNHWHGSCRVYCAMSRMNQFLRPLDNSQPFKWRMLIGIRCWSFLYICVSQVFAVSLELWCKIRRHVWLLRYLIYFAAISNSDDRQSARQIKWNVEKPVFPYAWVLVTTVQGNVRDVRKQRGRDRSYNTSRNSTLIPLSNL